MKIFIWCKFNAVYCRKSYEDWFWYDLCELIFDASMWFEFWYEFYMNVTLILSLQPYIDIFWDITFGKKLRDVHFEDYVLSF